MRLFFFLCFLTTTAFAQPCTGIVTTYNKQNQTRWFEKTVISNGLAKNSPIRKITVNRGISTAYKGIDSDYYGFLWFEVFTESPKYSVDGEAVLILSDESEISLPIKLKPKLAGKQFYSSALLSLPPDRVEQIKENRIVKVRLDELTVDLDDTVSKKLKEDFTCIMNVK